jgi:hypothetical protein
MPLPVIAVVTSNSNVSPTLAALTELKGVPLIVGAFFAPHSLGQFWGEFLKR